MIELWLRRALMAIGAITLATGLTQLMVPNLILGIVGADTSVTSAHFFATVGMFMALFGALLLQALRTAHASIVVFWTAMQKLGASGLVAWGVSKGVFGVLALGVCGFDFLSGLAAFWYWRVLRTVEQ